nr:MAG TPA: hypothetical protein [Caudoviricetes sp.]
MWALFPVFSRLLTGKKQPCTHDYLSFQFPGSGQKPG